MGTKITPTYGNLTFAYLEENLYEIIGKKYNNIPPQNLLKFCFFLYCIFLYYCISESIFRLLFLILEISMEQH